MVDDPTTMDIAQIVAEHHTAVFRYAYRLAGNVPDAEDLTQQAFLTAHEKLGQLRKEGSARSWLLTILRNQFLKNCQKRSPIAAEDLRLSMEAIPAATAEEPRVDQERLQQAIDDLPANYRVVLAMFYFEDCSYREIAEKLDVPMGTVMSRLARAKGHLRSKLFAPGCHAAAAGPCQSTVSQGG